MLEHWAARLKPHGAISSKDLDSAVTASLDLLRSGTADALDQARAAEIIDYKLYLQGNGFKALQSSLRIYSDTLMATKRELNKETAWQA